MVEYIYCSIAMHIYCTHDPYICFSFDGKKEFEFPADNFYDCGHFRKYWPINMNEEVFFDYIYS